MSTHNYLDKTGLGQVWGKIKDTTLTKNNTTSYTPTADYNPATKKYVDDNIGSGVLIVNITDGETEGTWVADKAFSDIFAAYTEGTMIAAIYNDAIYQLVNCIYDDTYHNGTCSFNMSFIGSNNGEVSVDGQNIAIYKNEDSSETVVVSEYGSCIVPIKVSDLQNDSGYITSYIETDPVFAASPAHGITANDISNWNSKTSLTLGTTSSTAFRGDYGNDAYAHAVTNKGSAFTSGLYKITTNSEGHVTAATAVAKSDITGLGIPAQDTTYTFDGTYNASSNKAATVSTVTNAVSSKANSSDVLTKTNTTSYTPAGDYNPATKKYVDDTAKPKDLMVNITSTWDENTQSNILTADKTFTEVMTAIENGTLVYFTDEYSEGLPFTSQAYAMGSDYINLDSLNLDITYIYNSDGTIQEFPYMPFWVRPEMPMVIGGSDAEAGELTRIYKPAKYSHSKGELIWLLPDIGSTALPYLVIDDINAGDILGSNNVYRIYLWDYLKEGNTFVTTITSTTVNDVTTYSADKTFAEISEAYESGKNCIVIKQSSIYVLSLMASTGCCFTNTYANNNFNRIAYETIRISSSDDITVYNKPFLTTEGTHNVYSNKKLIASVNGNFNTTPTTGSLTYSTTAYKAYDKDDLFWKDNTTLAKATTNIASGGTLTENTNYISTTISDELKDIRASHLSKTNTTVYTPTADYHPATKKYVDDATAGITSNLSGLTDTVISSPSNGQVLMYNSTSGKWENTTLPIYNGGVSS